MEASTAAWRLLSPSQAADCQLLSGDILVTKSSGSSDLVGKSALFTQPTDTQSYVFSNFLLRLRPNASLVVPEYLAWFLRSPQALAWRMDAQQNAVGLRNLKTKAFLQQQLPAIGLDIQKDVVRLLSEVESGGRSLELAAIARDAGTGQTASRGNTRSLEHESAARAGESPS